MPLTLGILGFGQDNGNSILPPEREGFDRQSSLHFQKLTSKDLLQRIKNIDQANPSNEKAFSIQQSSYQSIMNCFQLLNDLTNYSHEMFTDLSKMIHISNTRIKNVSSRISQLHSLPIEDNVLKVQLQAVPATPVTPDATNNNNGHEVIQTFQSAPYKFTTSLIDRHQLSLSLIRNLEKLIPNPNFQSLQIYVEQNYLQLKAKIATKSTNGNNNNAQNKLILEAYSSPQFFLNAWMLAQEERLIQSEIERKQHKADRKKREKVKEKAQIESKRKSDIQVVRWKDRYTGDGRSAVTSLNTLRSKSTRSQIHRSQLIRSLNFDEEEDEIGSTKAVPPPPPSDSRRPSLAGIAEEPKGASLHDETPPERKTPPKLHALPSLEKPLSRSSSETKLDEKDEGIKPRNDSIASVNSDGDSISPPAFTRPSLQGIFPSAAAALEDDDEEERSPLDLSVSTEADQFSLSSTSAKARVKSMKVLKDEDILPKIYSSLKNFTIDLDDSSAFVSPIPFVVLPSEALSTTSNRQSTALRYSAIYDEKTVSTRTNPEKPPVSEITEAAGTTLGGPSSSGLPPRPKPPQPPAKREIVTEQSENNGERERKVSFTGAAKSPPPPPPPTKINVNNPQVSEEDRLVSPLNRGNDRRLVAKSVRIQKNADILATAARPPPPPPPPKSKPVIQESPPTTTLASELKSPPPPPPPAMSISAPTTPPLATTPPPPPPPKSVPLPPTAIPEVVSSPAVSSSTTTPNKLAESEAGTPSSRPLISPLANLSPMSDTSNGSRPNFLDAIRRGSVLRKVNEEEIKPSLSRRNSSLGAFGSNAVNAILERRKFVEEPTSDSDSDGDDEDWS